jgi:superfamily II DNA or RNA helicase
MSGFRIRKLEGTPLWSIGAGYYSPKLNQVARSVPGMRFDSKLKAHVGYVDAIEQVVARLRELGLNADDPPPNERKWPHNLPVSYEGARDYQKEGIDFLINQAGSGALLADDMGCIDGDAVLRTHRTASGRAIDIRLSMFYRVFNGVGRRRHHTPVRISSFNEAAGIMTWSIVRAVLDKGERPVVKLTHTNGDAHQRWRHPLRMTPDHEVATPEGFRPVGDLVPGDKILVTEGLGYRRPPDVSKVVAVEPDGVTHVYDIVCEDPHRSFIANGIIVHNCGKSYQTVKAVRALRRKTIIVCEAHVRGVWEREPEFDDKGGEVARWWPKAEIFKPYKIKPTPIPPNTDVVVIHYDIIYAWVDALLEWAGDNLTIVFDEFQMLLNATSRRSKACRTLAHAARGRIGLSGTPPVDKVKNLHNAVDTICPGRFGEFFAFCMRHADAKQIEVDGPEKTRKLVWTFDGKSNLKELRQRLDWFCLRRTKREVMKELPALQRQIVDVEVPPKHRIALNARLVGDKRKMRMALDSAADGKFKHVLALIQSHLESGQRVVVATYRRAVCEKICDAMSEIAPTKFIHGGVPLTRRNKIIAELRRVEGPCCLVANIDCTATGIDLTFANVGVIAELVWEPRDLVQWEARAHRFGASTKEPVLMQYVIARGTGDELILHAVINKLDNFLDLVETDAGDGLKEALVGKKDEGLSRLAATLKKMGKKGT